MHRLVVLRMVAMRLVRLCPPSRQHTYSSRQYFPTCQQSCRFNATTDKPKGGRTLSSAGLDPEPVWRRRAHQRNSHIQSPFSDSRTDSTSTDFTSHSSLSLRKASESRCASGVGKLYVRTTSALGGKLITAPEQCVTERPIEGVNTITFASATGLLANGFFTSTVTDNNGAPGLQLNLALDSCETLKLEGGNRGSRVFGEVWGEYMWRLAA